MEETGDGRDWRWRRLEMKETGDGRDWRWRRLEMKETAGSDHESVVSVRGGDTELRNFSQGTRRSSQRRLKSDTRDSKLDIIISLFSLSIFFSA